MAVVYISQGARDAIVTATEISQLPGDGSRSAKALAMMSKAAPTNYGGNREHLRLGAFVGVIETIVDKNASTALPARCVRKVYDPIRVALLLPHSINRWCMLIVLVICLRPPLFSRFTANCLTPVFSQVVVSGRSSGDISKHSRPR